MGINFVRVLNSENGSKIKILDLILEIWTLTKLRKGHNIISRVQKKVPEID
jgi:hypothetical protein